MSSTVRGASSWITRPSSASTDIPLLIFWVRDSRISLLPNHINLAADVFKKQLKGIDVGRFEYDLYDKNGKIKTIETKERLIWEGDRVVEVYGIARDVTDRKRVEAALRESEVKYRRSLKMTSEGYRRFVRGWFRLSKPHMIGCAGSAREAIGSFDY